MLARFYGWTPSEIGKLTYKQILAFLNARIKSGADSVAGKDANTVPVGSWQEAKAMLATINAGKES